MNRVNFTQYDHIPEDMANYLRYYGPHFNKKLFEFAVGMMTKDAGGATVSIKPYTKEQVDQLLEKNNIKLKYNQLYDAAYVANMCKADFLSSSVPDEHHLALYIKNVIDDVDGYDGLVFNRWYADMAYKGIAIDWDYVL